MRQLDIEELSARAADLEANGSFTAAMHVRERLLLLLQPLHGDPSPKTDHQKLLLSKLILKVVDFRDDRVAAGSGGRGERSAAAAEAAGATRSQPLLTESLSTHGLLAFAERLLAPGNTLAATQDDLEVMDTRARLLLGLGQVLHRQGRPRAAVPLVLRALAQLRRIASDAPTLDIANAHLALCALHSAANHHAEALAAVHQALAIVLDVEETLWRNDPQSSSAAATASVDGSDVEVPAPPLRAKVYYGGFQAACYHNLSTEQEHLGLYSLALESCQTGFELSHLSNGATHPLTLRLRKTYAEIFTALHYRQYATKKKQVLGRVFHDPEAAVAQLNATYLDTLKHRQAMARELRQQDVILDRVQQKRDVASPSEHLSSTQRILSGRIRPTSAMASTNSKSGGNPATRRPVSAVSSTHRR